MFQVKKKKELEGFNKKKNTIIIASIFGIMIIGIITLFKIFVFFEERREINIIKRSDSSDEYDMNLLSVKLEGKEVENIPERGLYKIQVECTNGYGEWDYNSWSIYFVDLKENTKCNVEFTKNLSEEEYNQYLEVGKALRRNTYRGKNITEYYNDGSLYEMISSGRFDDIYIGDYINTNGVTWLIADIDNYLYSGAQELSKHHATIIPAIPLMNIGMNATNTTEGGYYGSRMVTETLLGLVASDGTIGKAFGSHIIEYQNILSNHVNTTAINQSGAKLLGASDEWNWYTRKVDLMSEVNVYGTTVWSSSGFDIGIDNRQYAIFQLKPKFINSYDNTRFRYWLKAVSDATKFASVSTYGDSSQYGNGSSGSLGVRPRFLIG